MQKENWTATGVIWLIVFVFALLRGGRGGASLIPVWTARFGLLAVAACWYLFLRR